MDTAAIEIIQTEIPPGCHLHLERTIEKEEERLMQEKNVP